jgi:hypothetical protein
MKRIETYGNFLSEGNLGPSGDALEKELIQIKLKNGNRPITGNVEMANKLLSIAERAKDLSTLEGSILLSNIQSLFMHQASTMGEEWEKINSPEKGEDPYYGTIKKIMLITAKKIKDLREEGKMELLKLKL